MGAHHSHAATGATFDAGSRLCSTRMRGLAASKVYKEIAHDLGIAASTVRSHLHNVYAKLGAADRAQAVLIASREGWI